MSSSEGSPSGIPRKRFKQNYPTPPSSPVTPQPKQPGQSQPSGSGLGKQDGAILPKFDPAMQIGGHGSDSSTVSSSEGYPDFSPEVEAHYKRLGSNYGGLDFEDYESLCNNGEDSYVFVELLGKGTYATVFKGYKTDNMNTRHRQEVAIKVLKPTRESQWAALDREAKVVEKLMEWPHPNIVTNIEQFGNDTQTAVYFISELAPIGDLYQVMTQINSQNQKIWVPLKQQYCQHLIRGIALGVQHMFSLGISHGDIKFENILVSWDNSASNTPQDYGVNRFMRMIPKLTDFNNSKIGVPGGPIMHPSPRCAMSTAAPESYYNNGVEYDMKVADVYSVGACLLSMLLGCYPFIPYHTYPAASILVVYNRNKKDRNLIKEVVRPFEHRLKQVLLKMIEPNPQNRITIEEFLADEWITRRIESQELEERWESNLWKGVPHRERKHSV